MVDGITNDAVDLLKKIFNKRGRLSQGGFFISDLIRFNVIKSNKACKVAVLLEELEEFGALKLGIRKGYSFTKKAYAILNELVEEENNIYTDEYRVSLEEDLKNYSTFVISTAVQGKAINELFVKSLENYAKRRKAKKLVIPCEDVVSRGKKVKTLDLDPGLESFSVVFKDLVVAPDLMVSAIKISAKQILPTSGLERLATKNGASIIVGAPKRIYNTIPSLEDGESLFVSTTGALTVNDYDNERYMSQRTSTIAENDHVYAAVVVELDEHGKSHLRFLEASGDGSFVDLGVRYFPDGKIKGETNSVIVMGDSHVGYINKNFHDKALELIGVLKADTIVLHDVFNGTSITHHDEGKWLTKASKALKNQSSLKEELRAVKAYLELMKNYAKELIIPDANHDSHLTRYLDEGRFLKDPINTLEGLKLSIKVLEGENPVKYAVEQLGLKKDGKIKWLDKNESYKKYGVELGLHGHKGANGAKGSSRTFDKCVGNCVTAHTHSASILRDAYCVGTSTLLRMDYNDGLSNWTNTCCIIYKDGTKQLVTFRRRTDGTFGYRRER